MKIKLPKMFLSGFSPTLAENKRKNRDPELEWLERSGTKYRCLNFAYICPGAFYFQKKMQATYEMYKKRKIGIFMDSSAFSFWQFLLKQSGKHSTSKKLITEADFNTKRDETVELYVDFVKKESKNWEFYANFDFRKNCKLIWDMQLKLEKMGIKPAPVYHGDDSIDYLKRYCDRGHKYICIGGFPSLRRSYASKVKFFDRVFYTAEEYKVKVHGFAFTSLSFLLDFPWYSVDSATWAKTSAYGKILVINENHNVMDQVHISDHKSKALRSSYNYMPKSLRQEIEEMVSIAGFDFELLRTSLYERCVWNAYVYNHLEDYLNGTKIKRSKWEDLIT